MVALAIPLTNSALFLAYFQPSDGCTGDEGEVLQEVVNLSQFTWISIQVNAIKRSFPWARHWARMFRVLSAASITERPQLLIVNKSNIKILLAQKWCFLPFYFIFNSKCLRHKHSVAVGVQRHPTKPNASKRHQNNMVPAGFVTFRSGCSLEVASCLKLACIQMAKSVSSPFAGSVLIEQDQN